MSTKETDRAHEQAETTKVGGEADVYAVVDDEATPKKVGTYPISGRVAVKHLPLIDDAAKRREMKRSDLVVAAVLQFIGQGRADARKVFVQVPDEVRREVRAAQTAAEEQTVALNRLGHNVLPQLKRYWAEENVHNDEIVALLTSVDEHLAGLREQAERNAAQMRVVLERPEW